MRTSLLLFLVVFTALSLVADTFFVPTASSVALRSWALHGIKRPPKDRARDHVNKRIKPGVRTTRKTAQRKFRGFQKKKKENPYADDLTQQLMLLEAQANATGKPLIAPTNLTISQELVSVVEEFLWAETVGPGLGKYYLRGKLSAEMLHTILEDVRKELKSPNIKYTFPGSFPKGEYPLGVFHTWKKKAIIQFMCRCASTAATSNGLLICDEQRRVYRLEESLAPLCYQDRLSVVVLENEAHAIAEGEELPFEFMFLAAYTGMEKEELQESAEKSSAAYARSAAEDESFTGSGVHNESGEEGVEEENAVDDSKLLSMFLDEPGLTDDMDESAIDL